MLRNVVLLGVASLLALALAEGLLRLFPSLLPEEAALRMHWRALGAARTGGEETITDDADLGFRYLPERTTTLERGDFAFTFTTDDNGFRNPWPWPAKADIVVVGDSMALGYGVADEATWIRRLEQALPGTAIVNLGMIGTGPPQYLEVLRRHGLALDPDLVLFTVFPGNDLNDAENFEAWQASGSDLAFRDWLAQGDADQAAGGLLTAILHDSYLVAVLRAVRRNLGASFQGETLTLDDGSRLVLAPTAYLSSVAKAQPSHPVFERVMAVIAEAERLSRAQGAGFAVLLVPTKEEVYLAAQGHAYPPLVEAFARGLEGLGITYLDLGEALRARAAAGEQLYFTVDGHPNERGYAVIADAVRHFLDQRDDGTAALTPPKAD